MNAVRFYSRSGNTKAVADAIAKGARTRAISVDTADARIDAPVDTLFVGGALYAYGLDKHLKAWLDRFDSKNVQRAVVFSTSWLSKHALDLIRDALATKGIPVESETFYNRGKPDEKQLKAAEAFGEKYA